MNKYLFIFIVAVTLVSGCKRYNKYEGVPFTEKEPRDWENPGLTGLNRVNPHATMISYPDELSALASVKENSPNYLSLDGIWKFRLSKNPG